MNNMKKSLAVAVILLFLGVAVAPSINGSVVRAASDDEFIEITSEACGITGFGDTTVKLTKQQYSDLQQYLVEFRAQLNQTTTREEAVPIFNEAVVELNKYGLLPKGMNVEQAQKLVTRQYQHLVPNHLLEKLFANQQSSVSNNSNFFCMVCGVTDLTYSAGPFIILSSRLFDPDSENFLLQKLLYFFYEHGFMRIVKLIDYILIPLILLSMFGLFLNVFNPLKIVSITTFGGYVVVTISEHGHFYDYVPTSGWIATFGVKTIKIFQNQPLWGNLPLKPINENAFNQLFYPGIIGFTGLEILLENRSMFHIGSALWVNIGTERPS